MKNLQVHKALNEIDREALDEIYRAHHRRVYSICLNMTRNASESEDLTHEVFINVFRKIDSFRGDAAFTTWLHRVTVNQVLMHFRRRKVRPETVMEDDEEQGPVSTFLIDPQHKRIADGILLTEVMAKLPKGCREVFVLHDIAGLGHDEIAALKGRSSGTSRSQLHKARASLRNLINQPGPVEQFRGQSMSVA
ncbi:MAG TPA: RNA polymerase sigma factor [Pyrinomonadaceae bacterium]|nr:RNA polymerase sigma factor [Pyrinomonadaceae bacterium]